MKKPNIILLLLMVLACLAACHKDKEMDVKEAVVSNEEMTVPGTQVCFSWQVDFAGQFQTGVEVSQSENMADLRRVEASKEEDKFVAVVDSLTEGKKYYYRIVVWNKFGSYEETVKDFTTAKTFSIHVDASEGGTAVGGGTFAEGDTCTVVATANEGYNFVNWTENGSQVSADAEYSFAVTGNRSLMAHFTSQEYTITATAEPEEGGTVNGFGGYNNGDECTLTATANEGYEFLNWTKEDGTIVSTEPVYAFTVTETAAFVAHFQIKSYTITIAANPNNGGTVDGGGTYEYGQSCTVHATEANGYHFVNWTENDGQVSSSAEYTFIVTGDRDLVANFSAEDYIISVEIEPEEGGTVTGAGGYNYGDECTLKATANEVYDFVNWTKDDGTVISTDATYSFTVTESASFVAHFQIRSFTVTVSANPNNGGSVYVGYSPGATQGTYNSGQYCTVHAIANSGYRFANWTENDSVVANYATYDFHVTSDRELVAHFTRVYTINVSANPTNGGTVTGSGFYEEGKTCRVTATANPNFTFVNWMDGSQVASIDAEYTFTVTGNRTLVAHFEPQAGNYTISVSANPSNGGTVSGGGQYQQGQTCTVQATANSNYTFSNWTEGGTVVSTQANYQFTVYSNRTLVANFTYNGGGSAPEGAINGKFTINGNGDKVYFSQGNLQYNKTTQEWSFMDHQYDMVETDGQYVGENYANQNIVSLFGWGTSGWNNGNVYYQPWDTQDNGNYNQGDGYGPTDGTDFTYDLTGEYSLADWGVHNFINNTTGAWRTLTQSEWIYVFITRTGIRYAYAQITGTSNGTVNGMILFPDDWSTSIYNPNNYNQSGANFSSNSIPATQWSSLEAAGAVFLPAVGSRNETSVYSVGFLSYYWSASASFYNADCVNFGDGMLLIVSNWNSRKFGQSVRLVCSAP
ncbi:MAG: InlB B-repeat-containing protein [Bacteroidales bacterium]|nr:InlB B-repeat-containing protein [Bacteroidales bacterium]